MSALAGLCVNAEATDFGYVWVNPVGGSNTLQYPLDLTQLTPDVSKQVYTNVATSSGGDPQNVTVTEGFSVPALVSDAGISAASFTVAEAVEPDARAILLTNEQATSKTAFPDGPAVVWQDSAGEHFLIPSTGSGEADEGETFTVAGQTLLIQLHSGALLSVEIASSTQTVDAGGPVRFTSTTQGELPGESLEYKWYFDDGTGASQASVVHRYLVPGIYDAYLRVIGSKDSLGISSVIPIKVGRSPKGPDRSGGGENRDAHAPTSGPGVRGVGRKTSTKGMSASAGSPTTRAASAPRRATAGPRTKLTSSRSHRAARRRPPPPTTPLLSGITVDATRLGRSGSPPSSHRLGTSDPARVGDLLPAHRDQREGLWIALGTLLALAGGAVLQWSGPSSGRFRFRSGPRFGRDSGKGTLPRG